MTGYFQSVLDFIGLHPALAVSIAFFVAFGEALFVIGLFIPSTVVLVGIGGLVGMGKLSIWPVFFATAIGAALGDGISYAFGHHYRSRLVDMWPFSRYRELVATGQRYFARHGGKSIVIGRFIPGVKSVVPGIAGMMGMNFARFTVLNVLSAFAWAIAHLAPGISAGWAMMTLASISKRLAVLVALLLLGTLLALWITRHLLVRITRALPRARAAAAQWAAHRNDRLGQIVNIVAAPHYGDLRVLIGLIIVLFAAMLGFIALLLGVLSQDEIVLFDHAFSEFIQSLRTRWTDKLMVVTTMLGDGSVVAAVTGAAVVSLMLMRRYRLAGGMLIGLVSAAAFVQMLKPLVHAERPIALYTGASAYSFPSGHATSNAVLYGVLALLAIRGGHARISRLALITCLTVIAAIAFSRIYLAAHWPSDVLAGLLFGSGVIASVALVYGQTTLTAQASMRLMGVCAAALLIFGSWHAAWGYKDALAFYAPRERPATTMQSDWRTGGWKSLPAHRIDLGGETEEPFVLQWHGNRASLQKALRPQGWQEPPLWSLAVLNAYAYASTSPAELPTLPKLHDGRVPALTLIKPGTVSAKPGRFVLRAWKSNVVTASGISNEFLLGSVFFERLRHPLGQFSVPIGSDNLACDGAAQMGPLANAMSVAGDRLASDGACGGSLILAGQNP